MVIDIVLHTVTEQRHLSIKCPTGRNAIKSLRQSYVPAAKDIVAARIAAIQLSYLAIHTSYYICYDNHTRTGIPMDTLNPRYNATIRSQHSLALNGYVTIPKRH